MLFFIISSAILHFSGVWYGAYLPISDPNTYDNTGALFNTTRVLTPDFTLDEQAYQNYSPLFIRCVYMFRPVRGCATDCSSTTFAMSYGLSFASISALVVHTFLNYRKQVWKQYQNSTTEKPDIHMKLMRKYQEAPTWWYMSLFVVVSRSRLSYFASH